MTDIPDVKEFYGLAAAALRGPTREMVERMRGEWERIMDSHGKVEGFLCRCGRRSYNASAFCPACGEPKTDKAVDFLWKRWKEAVKNA